MPYNITKTKKNGKKVVSTFKEIKKLLDKGKPVYYYDEENGQELEVIDDPRRGIQMVDKSEKPGSPLYYSGLAPGSQDEIDEYWGPDSFYTK